MFHVKQKGSSRQREKEETNVYRQKCCHHWRWSWYRKSVSTGVCRARGNRTGALFCFTPGAEEVVAQISASGGKASLIQADLRNYQDIARLVKEAHERLGPIDTWINNAGASANSEETKGMSEIEIFERMVGVDILGTWRCCREVEPYMRDGGCILTAGWDRALDGGPGLPKQMYAISKGAIMSLTRCLAAEFAPRVRVNCIVPGRIENEWSQNLSAPVRQKAMQGIPLKRWGTPDDILGTALFLASPAASFITGQTILVNGGEIMR